MTADVQGDDSYVVITLPEVAEIREILGHDGQDVETFEDGAGVIARHVLEWNWVDDDDKPLPVPTKDPSVVDRLTTLEYKALIEFLLGSEEDRKN